MMTTKPIRAWWMTDSLGSVYGKNNSAAEAGLKHRMPDGSVIRPGGGGFHGCTNLLDALRRWGGGFLWLVELSGEIEYEPGVYAASHRTYIAGGVDITPVLRNFAWRCALAAAPLWGGPRRRIKRLMNGDEGERLVLTVLMKNRLTHTHISRRRFAIETLSGAMMSMAVPAARAAASCALNTGARQLTERRLNKLLAKLVTQATGLHL